MVSSLVLLGVAVIVVGVWFTSHYARRELLRLHGSTSTRDESLYMLEYSPPRITPFDVALIIGSIVWKYFPSPIGPAYKLLPRKEQDGFELPLLAIEAPLTFTARELDTFSQAIRSRDTASVQDDALFKNPFLLISLTTPMMLILLSHPKCPIKPLGAVNTGNTFIFHDRDLLRDSAGLLRAAENGKLKARAEMGGATNYGQRKRRGFHFMIYVTVYFQGKSILTQEVSSLQFLPKNYKPLYKESPDAQPQSNANLAPSGKSQGLIELDLKAPLRWAASCRDYNPIHVSKLLAKAFGFSSTIVHGNHVVALAVQQLYKDGKTSTSITKDSIEDTIMATARDLCWRTSRSTKLEVFFLKPNLLPTTLSVYWNSTDDDAVTFVIAKGDSVRTRGKVSYS